MGTRCSSVRANEWQTNKLARLALTAATRNVRETMVYSYGVHASVSTVTRELAVSPANIEFYGAPVIMQCRTRDVPRATLMRFC